MRDDLGCNSVVTRVGRAGHVTRLHFHDLFLDECVQRTRALTATGVDDLIFPLLGGGRLERLQVLTEQIAPEAVR